MIKISAISILFSRIFHTNDDGHIDFVEYMVVLFKIGRRTERKSKETLQTLRS